MGRGWVPQRPEKTGGLAAAKHWLASRLNARDHQTKPEIAVVAQAVAQHVPVASSGQAKATMQHLVDDLLGLGPLAGFTRNPEVTDIIVDGRGHIWTDTGTGLTRTGTTLDAADTKALAVRLLGQGGKRLDEGMPFGDVQIGHARIHAVLPPIATEGPLLSIRLPSRTQPTLETLSADWPGAQKWLNVIGHLMQNRTNMLISGATGSGKAILYSRHMIIGKRHAAIYVRISQDTEGVEAGVQRQEQDCRQLAERLNLHVVHVYRDNDIGASSKSTKARPAYKRMLDDVRAGRFSIILAYSNSRITRRPLEWEELINLADSDHGLQVHTVASSSTDFGTADGRMILRYLAAADAAEAERMGERIARAKLDSVKHGRYRGGSRPFGYEPDGITPREPEFSAITEASRRIIAGESLASVSTDLGSRGLTGTRKTGSPLKSLQLRDILRRPRNAGLMEHHGQIVGEASWPAAVTEDVFTAVRSILDDPSRAVNRGGTSIKHLGSSTYLCGRCGAEMRVGKASTKNYRVYRCKASSHLTRKLIDVDQVVRTVIAARLDDAGLVLVDPQSEGVGLPNVRDQLAALRARRDQLALDYGDGLLDGRQLRTATARIDERVKVAEQQIAESVADDALGDVVAADQPGQAFLDVPVGAQRAILNALATVTIMPVGAGATRWKAAPAESIQIDWKVG